MSSLSKASESGFKTYVSNLEVDELTIDNLDIGNLNAVNISTHVLTVANTAVIVGSVFEPSNGDVTLPANINASLVANLNQINSNTITNTNHISSDSIELTTLTVNTSAIIPIEIGDMEVQGELKATTLIVNNNATISGTQFTGNNVTLPALGVLTTDLLTVNTSAIIPIEIGDMQIQGTLTTTQNITSDTLTVNTSAIIPTEIGNMEVQGDLTVTGEFIIGDLEIDNLTVIGNTQTDTLTVDTSAIIPLEVGNMEVQGELTTTERIQAPQYRYQSSFQYIDNPSTIFRCNHSILMRAGNHSFPSGSTGSALDITAQADTGNLSLSNFGYRHMLDIQFTGIPSNVDCYLKIFVYRGVNLVVANYRNKVWTNYVSSATTNTDNDSFWKLKNDRTNQFWANGRIYFNINNQNLNGTCQVNGEWQDFRIGQNGSVQNYKLTGSLESVSMTDPITAIRIALTTANHTGYSFIYSLYSL